MGLDGGQSMMALLSGMQGMQGMPLSLQQHFGAPGTEGAPGGDPSQLPTLPLLQLQAAIQENAAALQETAAAVERPPKRQRQRGEPAGREGGSQASCRRHAAQPGVAAQVPAGLREPAVRPFHPRPGAVATHALPAPPALSAQERTTQAPLPPRMTKPAPTR